MKLNANIMFKHIKVYCEARRYLSNLKAIKLQGQLGIGNVIPIKSGRAAKPKK